MLRKIIIFLAVFVVGMIATDDDIFNSAFFEKSNKNSKDDLSIISVDDTNDVIPHRPVHYNNLEMVKRVDGVVQYNIGARTRSKLTINNFFFLKITNFLCVKGFLVSPNKQTKHS